MTDIRADALRVGDRILLRDKKTEVDVATVAPVSQTNGLQFADENLVRVEWKEGIFTRYSLYAADEIVICTSRASA